MKSCTFPGTVVAFTLLLATTPVFSLQAAEEPAERLTQSYKVKPGDHLVLHTDRGSLHLTGGDQATAEIEVIRRVTRGSGDKARQLLENHEVRFSQDGDTVRVEADLKGADRWNWRGPNLEVTINVTLPRDFNVDASTAGGSVHAARLKGELTLRTSGGSLDLEALEGTVRAKTSGGSIKGSRLAGVVDVNTSGGSITLGEVRGSQLKAGTSGGSIRVSGLTAPAEVRTSGGSIHVESSVTPLSATTSGGSITAKLAAPPEKEVSLHTSAGGINLSLPAKSAFQLDASTSAGGVSSEIPVATTADDSRHRSSLKGQANGGGPLVKLRTSAGSIRVRAE